MISDSSPSNKRLNYSSVLSTSEWSTVAYAVPYPSTIKDNSNSKGYAVGGGGSISANKADSMQSSLLLSSAAGAATSA